MNKSLLFVCCCTTLPPGNITQTDDTHYITANFLLCFSRILHTTYLLCFILLMIQIPELKWKCVIAAFLIVVVQWNFFYGHCLSPEVKKKLGNPSWLKEWSLLYQQFWHRDFIRVVSLLPQFPNQSLRPDQRNIIWDSKQGFTIRTPTFYYIGLFFCQTITDGVTYMSQQYFVHRPGQYPLCSNTHVYHIENCA